MFTYNPETNKCDFGGITLPKPIEGHSVVKVGQQIFVFGGFDSYGVTNTIMRIDLDNLTAGFLVAKLAIARENHTS